MLAKDIDT